MRVTGWRLTIGESSPPNGAGATDPATVPDLGSSPGVLAAADDPGAVDGRLLELDERAGPLVLGALYGCPTPNGDGRPPVVPGVAEGEVAVEVGGDTRLVRPAQPVAPGAPTELLVVDVGHPAADWARLVDAPVAPDEHLAALDAAIEALAVEGAAGSPSLAQLQAELTEVDRRWAASRAGRLETDPGWAAERAAAEQAAAEADAYEQAALDWAMERAALDDELAALEDEGDAPTDEVDAPTDEVDAPTDEVDVAAVGPTAAPPTPDPGAAKADVEPPTTQQLITDAVALRDLVRATDLQNEADREAVAAANTARVLRRALDGRPPRRRGRAAWAQPALFGLAAALVALAVVLIVRGSSGGGIVAAVAGAAVAGIALTVADRSSRSSRPPGRTGGAGPAPGPSRRRQGARPAPSPEALRRRLDQAEFDRRTWERARDTRAARVTDLAAVLGLGERPGAHDLVERRAKLEAAFEARRQADEVGRRTPAAPDALAEPTPHAEPAPGAEPAPVTAPAPAAEPVRLSEPEPAPGAQPLHRQLAARRAVLDTRAEAHARSWAAWRHDHRLPPATGPAEAAAHYRAEAEALAGDVDDGAELRQLRQGLLDQLGRLGRELDRLVLARWLLLEAVRLTGGPPAAEAPTLAARLAGGPPAAEAPTLAARQAGGPPAAEAPTLAARRAGDESARPTRAAPAAPAGPHAGDGPSAPPAVQLRERTTELLARASGGRVVGLRVELPDRPVLRLAGGGELTLGADRDARVLADVCAVLATGELAAGPDRWPLVVTGLEAWPAGAGRQVVRDLLDDVATNTQVLLLTSATNGTAGATRA